MYFTICECCLSVQKLNRSISQSVNPAKENILKTSERKVVSLLVKSRMAITVNAYEIIYHVCKKERMHLHMYMYMYMYMHIYIYMYVYNMYMYIVSCV